MTKDEILATLRQHAPELQAKGLAHLRLFGSVARGEETSESDIDLLADFTPDAHLTLLGVTSLQDQLAHLLGRPVDLSSPTWLNERVRKQALQEAISAF